MKHKYSVVITTTASKEEAEKIAQVLLKEKLAACIQVSNIKSYYIWKESINVDEEFQLSIKCKSEDYSEIENCIKLNHSYEVPEIIQLAIEQGHPDYLNWIDEVTK
jgi:periplasmic divalent cation tolerance protein